MNDFWQIILLASLPALGNLLGSALAEWMKPAKRVVGIALHGAAGISVGVIAVELIPRAMNHAEVSAEVA